jgi:riboflavin kinase/FMN adenylyltransferase
MSRRLRLFHDTADAKAFLRQGSALTIGNYDGLHIGHRSLLTDVFFTARKRGLKSVLLTFDPHPVKVLAPSLAPLLINTLEQKIELVEKLGIDVLIIQKFNRRFASESPETFFKKRLLRDLNAKHITVGYDFTFGAGRQGTIETLEILGYQNNIDINIIDAKLQNRLLASSTVIRKLIANGDIKRTARLLDRPFFIDGKVIHGHARGAALGIRTANLATENKCLPKDGVYATLIRLGDKVLQGVTNIGFNPTFDDKVRSIETHIFDFSKSLYRKRLRLLFIDRLRDEKKFADGSALVKQIKKDIVKSKQILSNYLDNPVID